MAVELDRARVGVLHEVVPETLHPLDAGADLLAAGGLRIDVGHPHRAVLCKQRGQAIVVTHHHRVGELGAQRFDLDAISDGLKVAHHRMARLSVSWVSNTASPRIIPSLFHATPAAWRETIVVPFTHNAPSASCSTLTGISSPACDVPIVNSPPTGRPPARRGEARGGEPIRG